jgi:hypothetical protein
MSSGARSVSPSPSPAVPSPSEAQSMRGTASAAQEAAGFENGVAEGGRVRSPVSSFSGMVACRVYLFLDEGAGGASEVVVVVPKAGADVSRACKSLHACRRRHGDGCVRATARKGSVKGDCQLRRGCRETQTGVNYFGLWFLVTSPAAPCPCHQAETIARTRR